MAASGPSGALGEKQAQKELLGSPLLTHTHLPDIQVDGHGCHRAVRALQALVDARNNKVTDLVLAQRLQALLGSLRTTTFGQSFDPMLLERLLPAAGYTRLPANSYLDLKGTQDALYVLLTGSAEIVNRGQCARPRTLTITVDSATNLRSETQTDGGCTDIYVVIKLGTLEYKTAVASNTGPGPVFSWSATISYASEKDLEFEVMDCSDSTRPHVLHGVGVLKPCEFEKCGFEGALPLCPPQCLQQEDAEEPGAATQGFNYSDELPGMEETTKTTAGFLHIRVSAGTKKEDQARRDERNVAANTPPRKGGEEESGSSPSSAQSGAGNPVKVEKVNSGRPPHGPGGWRKTLHTRMQLKVYEVDSNLPPAPVILWPGSYFGAEENAGALRLLEECQMLFLPRANFKAELDRMQEARLREKHDFLVRWLPGASALDKRIFDPLAAAFQLSIFPRGHKLCTAGLPLAGDARRISILKRGTCRVVVPPQPFRFPGGGRGGMVGVASTSAASSTSTGLPPLCPCPIGLLSEGSIFGCASALLGLPEPFTAVTEETATVYWISVNDRPTATWPREVVHRLQDTLRQRIDWHHKRTQGITTAMRTHGRTSPVWGASAHAVADAETEATEASAGSSRSPGKIKQLGGSRSSPALLQGASESSSTGSPQFGRSRRGESLSDEPSAGMPQSFLSGGNPTPWGTWSPSGDMPPAGTSSSGDLSPGNFNDTRGSRRQNGFGAEATGMAFRNGGGGTASPSRTTSQLARDEPRETQRYLVDLKCSSDWGKLSAVALPGAVEKMYRQQVRLGATTLDDLRSRLSPR